MNIQEKASQYLLHGMHRRFILQAQYSLIFFSFLGIFLGAPLFAKQPSFIQKTQQTIQKGEAPAIKKAIIQLETLLETSFNTSPSSLDCSVILLLAQAYEKLNQYENQEQVLLRCLQIPQLQKYHIRLKATLARAYLHQIRFDEAEEILHELSATNCSDASLEEKAEISNLFFFRDQFIKRSLEIADALCEQNRFIEALASYKNVLPVLEKLLYPSSGSKVAKRRIYNIVLLRFAEVYFCLGKFQDSLASVQKIDERVFLPGSYQALYTRRLALLSFINTQLSTQKEIKYQKAYLESTFVKEPNLTPYFLNLKRPNEPFSLVLFQAMEAYKQRSSHNLAIAISNFPQTSEQQTPLLHILKGLHASIENDYVKAVDEIKEGLVHTGFDATSIYRENALSILARCSLARLILLSSSNQQQKVWDLSFSIIPLLRTSEHPHTQLIDLTIELLFTKDPDLLYIQTILHSIKASALPYDRSLFAFISQKLSSPKTMLECSPFTDVLTDETPLQKYHEAFELFQKALCDEAFIEKAQLALEDCLTIDGLRDTRPQVLSALVELSLRIEETTPALEYIAELLESYKTYPDLKKIAFSSLLSFENNPNIDEERRLLVDYLLTQEPHDINSFLTLLHLFEADHEIFSSNICALEYFQKSLIERESARNSVLESTKSTEMGLTKNQIQQFIELYNESISHIQKSIAATKDPESLNLLYGIIFNLHEEKISPLLYHIEGKGAFNELTDKVQNAASALSQDIEKYLLHLPHSEQIIEKKRLDELELLCKSACIASHIFKRELSDAVALAKNAFTNENLSNSFLKTLLYLCRSLRAEGGYQESLTLLEATNETGETIDFEVTLEIALEKSLCYRELHQYEKAMKILGWVINSEYPSALRLKAMIFRSELYLLINRRDLALRQLQLVETKGGEWAKVAERKLKELYGNG
jgi:tetratricopeptide (TPR) repeat protein